SYPGRTPTKPPATKSATSGTSSAQTSPASPVSGPATTPVLGSPGMGLTSQAAQAFGVSVLDRHESELVQQALEAVASRSPNDAVILQGLIAELRATSELLDRQRPLRRPTSLGGEERDEKTLIEHLCSMDGLSGD